MPTPEKDAEEFVGLMRSFYRADQIIALGAFVTGGFVALTVVESRWTIAFLAALVVNVVVIEYFHRRVNRTNLKQVTLLSIASVWVVCVVVSPIVSFALPALVMVVLISMLAAVPLLDRTEVTQFSIGSAVVLTLMATLSYSIEGPIDEQIPDWMGNLITTVAIVAMAVPLGALAWDTQSRQARSLDRITAANEALRESRGRLVDVADSERRRIERNLHDGAQQRFVGLTVKLRLLSHQHPEIADDLVIMVDEMKEALDELRALAHGIYPPLLIARGLTEALTAMARRAPIEVEVMSSVTGRYSQRIEVASYFCCLEALQNASRYGTAATTVSIEISEDDHRLRLVIADDGPGFDPDTTTPGHGLHNMADRLAAVNAELLVESSPGKGTRVSTTIPLIGQAGGESTAIGQAKE